MATRGAVKTGNWSDVTVWDGGVSLPGSGDTVVANTFTVTIDQDITVGTIQTLAAGAFASGGSFQIATGTRIINANCLCGTSSCAVGSGSANATINGNVTGGTTSSDRGVDWASSGTLNLNGNVTAGSNGSAVGLVVQSGTVNLTGNITAATAVGASVAGGTLNWLSGTGSSSTSSSAIDINNTGTVNISQSITSGSTTAAALIVMTGTAALTCNGNVAAETAKLPTIILNQATPTVTLNGTVTAADDVATVQGNIGPITVTANGDLVCSANGTFPINGDNSAEPFRVTISSTNQLRHTYKTSGGTRTLQIPIFAGVQVRSIGTY